MGQSFFIWNGIDCRAMGITMRGPAAIVRAEERVKHVEIPGRSGDLTETEGQDVFNSYIQTVSISVKGGFRVRQVYSWLHGSGYVTFSGEPDRRQKARVIGAITLNRVSRNMDHWAGEVQFYCQPLKERLKDNQISIQTSGTTIMNEGDVNSRPKYRVTASAATMTLTITGRNTPENNTIAITNLSNGKVIWIDSETMEVWNQGETVQLTKDSAGDFPVLGVGSNTVTFVGASTVKIERRERFL